MTPDPPDAATRPALNRIAKIAVAREDRTRGSTARSALIAADARFVDPRVVASCAGRIFDGAIFASTSAILRCATVHACIGRVRETRGSERNRKSDQHQEPGSHAPRASIELARGTPP
jgi:hypothetical protein